MTKGLVRGITAAALLLLPGRGGATEFSVAGKPANVLGFMNQGMAFGIAGAKADTKKEVQSAIFEAQLEGDYSPADHLKFRVAGKFAADWVYDFLSNNGEWQKKNFSDSAEYLHADTGWRKMLHEASMTWSPGDLVLRVGKQIVAWGETDGMRIMDQINPLDQRRGFSDVQFDTSVIPIWLLRADYYFQPQVSWLQDLSVETVFNPNADFQPNRATELGNDVGGIWTPNVEIPFPIPGAPGGIARVGSAKYNVDAPDHWKPEGYEFGIRTKAVISNMVFTLNYFNGLQNERILKQVPQQGPPPGGGGGPPPGGGGGPPPGGGGAPPPGAGGPPPGIDVASDGVWVVHPQMDVIYPRFRFAGVTFAGELPFLQAGFLGGVAPVLRLEAFYAFNNTFSTLNPDDPTYVEKFVQRNEIRYAVGLDWKVKIPFLNPRAYFMVSPQFFDQKILNYPSKYKLQGADDALLEEDNYSFSLMVNTTYFHNKLMPMIFWIRDITNSANMVKIQASYDFSDEWNFTSGLLFLGGSEKGKSFDLFDNKDQVYATLKYKF